MTVRGNGRGGRNVEFLLSLAVDAERTAGRVRALAGDTDGIDGAEEIAGAFVTPNTLARAAGKGIEAKERLASNDGHGFFETLGDQVVTGPTLTNVNDFRAILIAGPEEAARAACRNMRRQRNAKIVATLGPASSSPEVIRSALRGRGGCVPPQLQPRDARGASATPPNYSRDWKRRPGDPSACWPTYEGPSCASTRLFRSIPGALTKRA